MNSEEYFQEIAGEWDSIQRGLFPENLRRIAINKVPVGPDTIAADIGAGTGFITEELLRHGARVIAVDQSQKMLETLKRKFGLDAFIDCRVGTGEKLPIDDSSVDFAFANMYLHHVEDPLRAIKEMVRIIKPEGKIIITDLDEHQFEFLRTEQHDRWMGFKREIVKRWFEKSGLENITVESANETCCSSSECGSDKANVNIFMAIGKKKE